jgi:O-methyltransferase
MPPADTPALPQLAGRWPHSISRTAGFVRARLRYAIKHAFAPLLYRYPPIGLRASHLYFWADALYQTASLDGAIVEIGIAHGGTMAWSINFLRQIGRSKPYFGIDTFSGFVSAQFDADLRTGNTERNRHAFSGSSIGLVRRILQFHASTSGSLIAGDICTLPAEFLPARIACALVDVDLAVPVEAALDRIWPRLVPGGCILVDDCYMEPADGWQAVRGYRSFCRRRGLAETYRGSMGFLTAPAPSSTSHSVQGLAP